MAENSRSCKVWCVTLVAATLVLVARTGEPRHALVALVPIVLFYLLDAYYLMLERRFRNSYNSFVEKVHAGQEFASDLYTVVPHGSVAAGVPLVHVPVFLGTTVYVAVVSTVLLAWLLIL